MTTYSICVDDVDLALLPLRTNNFLKKEHYQFQVFKEHVAEVPALASDTYTCHICALDVPAAFVGEHAASVKHRTNARIASVATQRARAHISTLPPPVTSQSTSRFCANCTAIVGEDHDKTKEHRVAAMHDNLLRDLMKAYVGDDDESNDEENTDKTFKKNQEKTQLSDSKNVKNVASNNVNNVAIKTQTINDQKLQVEDKTNVTIGVQSKLSCESKNKTTETSNIANKTQNNSVANLELPSTSGWVKIPYKSKLVTENATEHDEEEATIANGKETKVKHSRESYEKELRKFMNPKNEFQIKEDHYRIHLKIDNDNVNVYSDHFHSFHRMYKDGVIECIVCNSTFNEKDSEAHKYSLDHMSAVVKVGSDGEYVREINDTYSHCILCNQKINNINLTKHKQSNHHVLRKTNNVRRVKTKADTGSNETTNGESKVENTSNLVDLHKQPYEEVNGELKCLVCDCRVPKDDNNRKDHMNGLRHLQNLKTK